LERAFLERWESWDPASNGLALANIDSHTLVAVLVVKADKLLAMSRLQELPVRLTKGGAFS
jgi:hypothetical protein